MGLFTKSRNDARGSITIPEKPQKYKTTQSVADKKNTKPVAAPVPVEINEVDQARKIVDKFALEVGDSVSKQQSALKRMNQLSSMLTKLDLDLKALRRTQAENRELAKIKADLEVRLSQKTNLANELDNKLNDLERRNSETRSQLEGAQAGLAVSRDEEKAIQAQCAAHERTIRSLTAKYQSAEDRVQHNESTMEKMQGRIDTQTSELALRERETMELKSALGALNEKYMTKAAQSDNGIVELKNLRVDYADMKARHVELSGELENTRYELQTQKNVLEDTIKRRDEENMALKTRIEQLDTQVRIKENMATHLDQEFISLRNSLVNERDRAEALDTRLLQKSEEYERASKALSRAKMEFDELNDRFTKTLDDYEMLRKINHVQREKLERYAAISGIAGNDLGHNAGIYSTDRAVERAENVEILKKVNRP